MIAITCKCIHCKKTWEIYIDEHDYERYIPGKQFQTSGAMSICSCGVKPAGEYKALTIDTVCEECGE